MAQHIGIVWNPTKTSKDEMVHALEEILVGVEVEPRVTWVATEPDNPGRGAADAAIAQGANLVIAAGGDGTVRAVAESVADAEGVELGIAPLGTGNLLARNLDVPINDLPAAFARALGNESTPLDLGWVGIDVNGVRERHAFAVMAGFGIDAHMITETSDDLKDRVGWLAYVESLGRAVSASEVIDLRVSENGADPIVTAAHTVLVGNCGTVQGGITLLPGADPRDGALDVLVLDAAGLGGWLDTMRNMLWDNGLRRLLPGGGDEAQSSRSTSHHRVTSLTVELEEPRELEIDGDILGAFSRIEFEVQPAALRVR
ncbi:diacylglycerol kinase family protein [Microbacterium sp. Marseille-Q6965]|uniref:diacylglycerol/lipid kinase family protein n=1 Tax=Microbacterium sp. Marseille-Q6965 TaxID=2965072 RepID=UPI0021B7329F|nr:diacylglycerol kinase family protein [Microbacterium sp. Marseille-Q6965]